MAYIIHLLWTIWLSMQHHMIAVSNQYFIVSSWATPPIYSTYSNFQCFLLSFTGITNQYLIPIQYSNEALSLFICWSLSFSLSSSSFLSVPLCLSFPLSGGLPAMSPWLLLRCSGPFSALRKMLGRFLLSGGCRSAWSSFGRRSWRTVSKRWAGPSTSETSVIISCVQTHKEEQSIEHMGII